MATPAPMVNMALCLGNFDGVHLGHQALLQQAATYAPHVGVVTMHPHPRQFFAPNTPPFLLTPTREQWQLLHQYGAHSVFVLPFAHLHHLSAAQFENYLRQLRPHSLHIGADFCYGAGRKGNARTLQQAGFTVGILPSVQTAHHNRVSSQQIRLALQQGDMPQVQQLLGRAYSFCGRVQQGQQLARTLGFATANIPWPHRLPPRLGVYAVRVQLPDGLWHNGVANVGRRPSVATLSGLVAEIHLFNGVFQLYNQRLHVQLWHFIRPEQHFQTLASLKEHIAADVDHAQRLLNKVVLG